jgi:HPt (histidine-containing phosphotransfer) domain-containing protein
MANEQLTQSSPIDSKVIDSLRELGGDDGGELLKELVNLFLTDTPPRLTAMDAAEKAKDAKALERAAHSLKSSCANLGAVRMSEICKKLEMLAKSGSFDGAAETIDLSLREYEAVKSALLEICR